MSREKSFIRNFYKIFVLSLIVMYKLPNLYFLRFFLATIVVIYHLPITSKNIGISFFDDLAIFHKGEVAVFYFFSLSGFLIIRNLYIEYRHSGSINLKNFFQRRMLRLWPLYYLTILCGIFIYAVLIPFLGVNYYLNYNLNDLFLYYIFFLPNVYNGMYKVGGILNITWSIGIEEQFYLIFPFFFLIFKNNIKLALFILFCILIATLFFYQIFYTYKNFYFYFIFGGLFAILAEDNKLVFLKNNSLRLLILILFGATFFTNFFVFSDVRISHIVYLLVANLLIVSLAYYPIILLDKLNLNYLGEISYGIYMLHMIVTTFYLYVIKIFNFDLYINKTFLIILNNVFIIFATTFLAHLSFKYFESFFTIKKYLIIKKYIYSKFNRKIG